MVLTRQLISMSFSPFSNPLVIIAKHQLQLVQPSLSCFTVFSVPEGLKAYIYFCFLSILLCCQSGYQSPQSCRFFFCFFFFFLCWLPLSLIVWPILDDLFVFQNLSGLCASHSPEQILGIYSQNRFFVYISFVRTVEFQFRAQFQVDHLVHPVVSSLIHILC